MSNWFFAANGQQQGPFPDAQFQSLIGNGTVRADTLVWTEGMAGWQKAGEVPGLMAVPPGRRWCRTAAPPPMMAGGAFAGAAAGEPGQALSPICRCGGCLAARCVWPSALIFVIPAPWVATWFYRWLFPHVQVPGRGNLTFTGQPLDIWWVFMLLGLTSYVGAYDNTLQLLMISRPGLPVVDDIEMGGGAISPPTARSCRSPSTAA